MSEKNEKHVMNATNENYATRAVASPPRLRFAPAQIQNFSQTPADFATLRQLTRQMQRLPAIQASLTMPSIQLFRLRGLIR
jgi:hypothetical protein